MIFLELFHEHRVHGVPEATAELIATVTRLSKRQREALMPAVIGLCRNLERQLVAEIEADELTVRRGGQLADRGEASRVLDESFAVDGSGRRVLWGAATVEDHKARIAFLASYVSAINVTIRRHEEAVARIEAHGVSCLNEIEVVA